MPDSARLDSLERIINTDEKAENFMGRNPSESSRESERSISDMGENGICIDTRIDVESDGQWHGHDQSNLYMGGWK